MARLDEPALRVTLGDETLEVSRSTFADWLCAWRGEYFAVDFARSAAIAAAAERAGVRLTDAQVEAALDAEIAERLQGAFGGRREDWLAELAQVGRSEAGYRAARRLQIQDELRVLALAGEQRLSDPVALARAFEARFGRGGRRLELDVIRCDVIVQSREGASREELNRNEELARRKGYEKALELAREVRAGKDFADLARRFSDDAATRESGGRVEGYFEPRQWPEAALDALAALAEGATSEPIFARGAWWVVRARRVVATKIDDVKPELEAWLRTARPTTDEVAAYASTLDTTAAPVLEPALWSKSGSPSDVVFRLGERPVTRDEFVAFALPLRGEGLLQTFLEHWWVEERARRVGITVDDATIERRIEEDLARKLRDLYGSSREKWLKELDRQGRTEASYYREQRVKARIDVLADLVLMRDRKFGEADLRRAWEARYGKDGRKLEVRMLSKRLVLPVFETEISRERYDEIVRQKKAEVVAALVELKRRAEAGESFAELAKSESDDPETKPQGGAFPGGWRDARFTVELATKLRALPVGSISAPEEITEAFAIFWIESERRVAFEDARAELERALREERPTPAERAGWINLGVQSLRVEPAPGLFR
ncbi:MAG: peptidylprolyl isomerase [Planctomycetes bacterium]|nr:peptidylprolyl isomerase [Planctomycetota bacterium]